MEYEHKLDEIERKYAGSFFQGVDTGGREARTVVTQRHFEQLTGGKTELLGEGEEEKEEEEDDEDLL